MTEAVNNDNAVSLIDKIEKLGLKSVNQIALQVNLLDVRFPATNLLTVSLHYGKTAVIEALLDRDMIDIETSCRRPLASKPNNAMLLGPRSIKG